jgi:ParB family chromosome partitioning protein
MRLVTLPLASIDADDRLRDVDPGRVDELALSMDERGLLQPIEVREAGERYRLVMGAHRLAAARKNKWTEISALLFEGTADEARLREIDENLYRRELSELDKAVFIAERLAIYERAFGEVKRGGGPRGPKGKFALRSAQRSFYDDVALKFGLNRRDVTRSLTRIGRIDAAAWKALRGTKFAEVGLVLDALARLEAPMQRQVVDLLLAGRARNVPVAVRIIHGKIEDVDERQFDALVAAWRRSGQVARRRFLAFVEGKS